MGKKQICNPSFFMTLIQRKMMALKTVHAVKASKFTSASSILKEDDICTYLHNSIWLSTSTAKITFKSLNSLKQEKRNKKNLWPQLFHDTHSEENDGSQRQYAVKASNFTSASHILKEATVYLFTNSKIVANIYHKDNLFSKKI